MSWTHTLPLRSIVVQELRETRRGWEIWVMMLLAVALSIMVTADLHNAPISTATTRGMVEGSRLTMAGAVGWMALCIVLMAQGLKTARGDRDQQLSPMSSAWPE
jgi:hypothetical protein